MTKHFKIATRLSLGALFLMLACTMGFRAYLGIISDQINSANLEKKGVDYIEPALRVLRAVSDVQSLQLRKQLGDPNAGWRLNGSIKEGYSAFEDLAAAQQLTTALQLNNQDIKAQQHEDFSYTHLFELWRSIAANPNDNKPEKVIMLLNSLQGLVAYVGKTSNLMHDPDVQISYVIQSIMQPLINTIRRLSDSMGDMYLVITKGEAARFTSKLNVWGLAGLLDGEYVKTVNDNFQTSYRYSGKPGEPSAFQVATERQLQSFISSNNELAMGLRAAINDPHVIQFTLQFPVVRNASYLTRDNIYRLCLVSLHGVGALLDKRIIYYSEKRDEDIMKSVIVIIIGLGFFWSAARGTIRPRKKANGNAIEGNIIRMETALR